KGDLWVVVERTLPALGECTCSILLHLSPLVTRKAASGVSRTRHRRLLAVCDLRRFLRGSYGRGSSFDVVRLDSFMSWSSSAFATRSPRLIPPNATATTIQMARRTSGAAGGRSLPAKNATRNKTPN